MLIINFVKENIEKIEENIFLQNTIKKTFKMPTFTLKVF